MKYSSGFRNNVLKKVLPPSNISIYSVSKETGVADQTIRNWIQKVKDGSLNSSSGELSTLHRNSSEKLNLLLKSRSLKDEELGKWLRENGIHSETLKLWEQEVREMMTDKEKQYKEELKESRYKIKELEKELQRKEKALAEVAALLTLKKKADAIWGVKEEE
jgi:transposase